MHILDFIRVLTLSGVFVAFLAYVALNLSFLHYITLHYSWQTSDEQTGIYCSFSQEGDDPVNYMNN